jgi:uncharacterized protein YcbK (DUF882 family)
MRFFDGTRRGFLHLGLSALACAAARPALAALPRVGPGLRTLAFHNLHTDERVRIAYWKDGRYCGAGCAEINHILRDHYSGDVYPIDVRLMDLLYDLQGRLGAQGEVIEIISGYRSPRTNAMLRSRSENSGVAKQSYHTKGMAIDIRMDGVQLPVVHNTTLAMRRGGVGYYPDSEFVHMDVGPVRRW